MEVVIAPERELPAGLRAQVLALHRETWGDVSGHDPVLAPLSMVLLDGGRVVAALDILTKELTHGDEHYRASGLSTVVTDPARRHEGIGLSLLLGAYERMSTSGVDLALFTCDEPLAPFYERAGFEVLAGT